MRRHHPRARRNPIIIAAFLGLAVLVWILVILFAPSEKDHVAAINQTVDEFHRAAAQADLERYFDLLSDDARFLGTDESERWPKPEFRAYCVDRGAFNEAPAWVYTPESRVVTLSPTRDAAWFDENLTNERYGRLRGSGVLVLEHGVWKIAQYNLTFLVPNDKSAAVVAVIREPADAADQDQPE